ncbi:alpha-l-rhamnosidase [Grosmannia clavigera kw1407]|uniref:Alpha-l-rhamnosidase n=1 Tax=Grosmannia clavigera (strain kw1407 / UAMH 11150) TaxID=655863 RepID=F0XHJ2_GROCL|nr:alpha-l-rhamnosidase [Grosmannia clavigera kw1407]EFX03327.1 alpha-l-rhamnosidase [Grosmannia clavigera kw1407]
MVPHWMSFVTVACIVVTVASSSSSQQQFLDSSLNDSAWQKHVRSPSRRSIAPVGILSQYSAGNVSNEDGLVGASAGPTVLTRLGAEEDVPTVVIDFGQNVAGLLSISFAGSQSTGEGLPGLVLAFSETLQYLTDRSDFTRSDNAGGIAVESDPYTWVNQLGCEHGNQVCADGLHGFRYVKIRMGALPEDAPYTSTFGSVSISSISLIYSGYLGTPDTFTGHFECSDANITQWWYDAVYTNDICTDVFLANNTEPRGAASPSLLGKLVLHDGAKRDRDPYIGDLAVSALTTYLSHDAPEAARNVLEDLALHQRDDGWIPPASIVLDVFYVSHMNPETSLIERPGGAGDYAFLPRTGPVTYYNALYVHALIQAAILADTLEYLDDSSRWRSRAAIIGPSLIQRNFDNDAGAFFDGGSCSSMPICPTHAQDGNSLAILSGVVPVGPFSNSSMAESILSYLNRTMARPYGNAFYDNNLLDPGSDYANRVYAFISYFEVAARFKASPETAQSALEELRRLYGWMSTHDPTVTFWEGIGADGAPYEGGFTSMAHGWSTGIVPLLMNFVIGVSPTAPGFREWNLRPVLDTIDLTWASALVPTPSGGIWVQWEKLADGFTLLVDSPATTKCTISVPFVAGASHTVSVDGTVVYDEETEHFVSGTGYHNGYITMSLRGGKHIVSVK